MEQNDISSRIVFADRGKVNVEKGVEFAPKFDQNGLIPALAMDHITHEPLMLAYMNAESLRMTMELGGAGAALCASGGKRSRLDMGNWLLGDGSGGSVFTCPGIGQCF